jgi:rod shape determining protein RodA
MSAGYYGADRAERLLRERVQERWTVRPSPTKHVDPVLVIAALLLTAVGVVMVYSATAPRLEASGEPVQAYAIRQLAHAAVGLVAMVAVAAIDYRHARTWAAPIYGVTVVLLGLVLTPLGTSSGGAQRWVELGGFQLQPSELAKVGLVIAVAALLHERKGDPGTLAIAGVIGLALLPAGLIILQPDIGTAVVFPFIAFILLLIGGTRARYLAGLAGAAIITPVVAFRSGLVSLEPYQLARITAFLDPSNVEFAQTTAYNTNQSMIAVGSGGFAGKGLLQGTQTSLAFVPENHTDFIFTVVGEEFGFIGGAVVLGLFAVLIWRGLRIAALSKDLFGTLVAAGAVAILTLQVFVNVGMTIGVAPVTGIPLPFVSYGGTSLLSAYILVGLMLNVHMRRF